MYHKNTNEILAEPMKNRSQQEIVWAQAYLYSMLSERGFQPQLQSLNNDYPEVFKSSFLQETNKVPVCTTASPPQQRRWTRNSYLQILFNCGDFQHQPKFTHAFVVQANTVSHHHPKPSAPFINQSKILRQSTLQRDVWLQLNFPGTSRNKSYRPRNAIHKEKHGHPMVLMISIWKEH